MSAVTPRVVFFGSDCLFSCIVLERLLTCATVAAVFVPAASAGATGVCMLPSPEKVTERPAGELDLPVFLTARATTDVALRHAIPRYGVSSLKDGVAAEVMAALEAEVACVACFPHRIPAALLRLPRHGFLNVHPSLLPRYRGPAPVFWQLRAGETETGVTVHWLDADLDTGDLAAQHGVPLAAGLCGPDIDLRLAAAGGELLAGVLNGLAAGKAARRPQPAEGTCQTWPTPEDFSISVDWPARRIFNFVRGTSEWGHPYRLAADDRTFWVTDVLEWAPDGMLEQPLLEDGETLKVQCTPGWVRLRSVR
jgi:methionyl-tRNA formyltransferase